jgi:hypothetical protein
VTRTVFRSSAESWDRGRTAGVRDLAIAGTALGCLGVAFVIPQAVVEGGPVVCPFRLATGLPCPGCGLARSWVALAHGDLETSLARHPFGPLLFALALAAVAAVGWRVGRRRLPFDLAAAAGSRPAVVVAGAWSGWWLLGVLA